MPCPWNIDNESGLPSLFAPTGIISMNTFIIQAVLVLPPSSVTLFLKKGTKWQSLVNSRRRLNCFLPQKTNLFCSSYSIVEASRFKTTFHDSCQIFVPEWVEYLISHTTCGPCFSDAEVCQREYKMGASFLSHRRVSWFSKRSCECFWSFNLFDFWSIVLDDHWFEIIYRPKMILFFQARS